MLYKYLCITVYSSIKELLYICEKNIKQHFLLLLSLFKRAKLAHFNQLLIFALFKHKFLIFAVLTKNALVGKTQAWTDFCETYHAK